MTLTERIPPVEHRRSSGGAKKSTAPALDRGLAILELLDSRSEGATLSEISRAIGVPKNSTMRMLQTLAERGYVTRDELTMRVALTGKLLRLGQPRVGGLSLVESALPAMRGLRDAVGETVQLGISIGDEGVVIERVESSQAVRIAVEIGLRFPLHNNAPGKVLLSHQSPRMRQQQIRRLKLDGFTKRTITNEDRLIEECETVVERGYGTDWGEADEGIHCVAAPIFDPLGQLVSVVWVSAVAGRMPRVRFGAVSKLVMQAAREIEGRLAR